MQCKYTPNFHGYLSQAQRYAIESLTAPEVCGYWKYESVWGNLTWNPDPVGTKDNVMLTGFSAICLATYAANTGDLRYQEKGCLQFRPYKGRARFFAHDTHSFIESLRWNWNKCNTYLYPCEPNFTYNICNVMGLNAVLAYDRVNGTNIEPEVRQPFWKNFYNEFMNADGSLGLVRSNLTGLSFFFTRTLGPFSGTSGVGYWINPVNPTLSKFLYALGRFEALSIDNEGCLKLPDAVNLDAMVDAGNYEKNPGAFLGGLALAAREQGDDAIAEAALKLIDKKLERIDKPGVLAYKKPSTTANFYICGARWARRNDLYDTINKGPGENALKGPLLTDCKYPDVLVARAMSMHGDDLELVLYNGAAAGHQRLTLERLRPRTAYIVKGDGIDMELTADSSGYASLVVHLDGRTALRIAPAA
jgi:hypothetical protein